MKIVELEKQEFIDFCNSNPQALSFSHLIGLKLRSKTDGQARF